MQVVALEHTQRDLSPELVSWNPSPNATHEFDAVEIEVFVCIFFKDC